MNFLSIEVYEARRQSRFQRLLPWLLGLLSILFGVALAVSLSRFSGQKAGFYTQVSAKLSDAKAQVETFSTNGTWENQANALLSLIQLDTVMEDGRRFVDSGISYNYQAGGFDDIADTILFGKEYNGKALCAGFLEDGALSAPEREYLQTLAQDLGRLETALQKNGQADTGLSIRKFNERTHVFFSKYSDVLSLKLSN